LIDGLIDRLWLIFLGPPCIAYSLLDVLIGPVSELSIAQIPLVASRHDTTSTTYRASRDVAWRDLTWCVSRACSNMADDEEAVVLACKTISFFIIIYYSSS